MRLSTARSLVIVVTLSAAGSPAMGTVLATDHFNVAGALTANGWTAHSAAGFKPVLSDGSAATLQQSAGAGEDVNLPFTPQTAAAKTFASFDVTVLNTASILNGDLDANGLYFAHFKNNATIFPSRVFVTNPSAGGDFSFGIDVFDSSVDKTWATDFSFDTPHKVVMAYDAATGFGELWLDPVSEASTKLVTTNFNAGTLVESFALRQSTDYTGNIQIDNVAVGTNFNSVFFVWDGSIGDWNDDARWLSGVEPTINDDVTINGGTVNVTLAGEVAKSITHNGGLLVVDAGNLMLPGADPNGIINLNADMTIQNSGAVTANRFRVGETGSSNMLLTGAASQLSVSQGLVIGQAAQGVMTVQDGATLFYNDVIDQSPIIVSNAVGADGSKLTVRDPGTTFNTNGAALLVGRLDQGTLSIEGGATVTASAVSVAFSNGGSANSSNVTVTGSGSLLDTTSQLTVGVSDEGHLLIDNSGRVNASSLNVGDGTGGGNSSVTVDGAGSLLSLSGVSLLASSVGDESPGSLSIQNGGRVEIAAGAGPSNIATQIGTGGSMVTVSGIGSVWELNGEQLHVGENAAGHLLVEAGGTVNSGATFISNAAGSSGSSVTVDGAGSTLTANGQISVGVNAPGSMTISNGGVVTQPLTSNFIIGNGNAGDNSTVTVTGTNSQLNIGQDLVVSQLGTNNLLDISLGADVAVANKIFIGDQVGRVGTVNLDGIGTTLVTDTLTVGHGGPGFLNVTNGAAVTTTGATILTEQLAPGVTSAAGGTAVTVDGGGSRLDVTGASSIVVGQVELASLSILNGGVVTAGASSDIAQAPGSTGSSVTVSGAGSRFDVSGRLTVGQQAMGSLLIDAGGVVTSGVDPVGVLFIGGDGGSTGSSVTVRDPGSVLDTNGLIARIGNLSRGDLLVESGGTINTGDAIISFTPAAGGSTAIVRGNGSRWDVAGDMTVGKSAAGFLTVDQGGVVNASTLIIAETPGSGVSQVSVQGAGSNLSISGFAMIGSVFGDTANLLVGNGASAQITVGLSVETGTLDLSGAGSVLSVGTLSRSTNEEIFNWTGGTLELTNSNLVLNESAFALLNNGSGQGQTPDAPNTAGNQADRLILTDVPFTGRNLIVSGTTSIDGDKGLTISGGTFRTAAVTLIDGGFTSTNPLIFNFGTLELTNSGMTIGNNGILRETTTTLGGNDNLIVLGNTQVDIGSTLSVQLGSSFTSGGLTLLPTAKFIGNGLTPVSTGPVFVSGLSTVQVIGTGNLRLGDASVVNGFFSNGRIEIDNSGTLTLEDANDAVLDSGALVLLGDGLGSATLAAANGITLDFGGNITGFGSVNTPNDPFKPFINNGNITGNSPAEPITLTGYVKGVGTLDNVVITGTDAPGFSPASVFRGSVAYAGTLQVEIGGLSPGSFDIVNHSGTATLGGILDLSLTNGFAPSLGDTFQFLTAASRVGEFSSILGTGLGGGLAFDVFYGLNDVTLQVILPGDLDGDGFVGVTDLNIVLGNWNQNLPPADPLADPSGDGFIGIADLNLVLGNWNAGTPPADASAVPEPTSLAFLVVGMVAMLRRVA